MVSQHSEKRQFSDNLFSSLEALIVELAEVKQRLDALEHIIGLPAQVRTTAPMEGGLPDPPPEPSLLWIIAHSLMRIADAMAPEPEDIVGTPYIAKRLGCTTVWIAELVRRGDIPKSCLVPGTGNGKVWKFYREHIDRWLSSR
jgi:hypothetical protein